MHRRSSSALARRFRRPLAARDARARRKDSHARARDLAFGVRAREPKVRLDQCVSREPILFPKLRIDFADFPCLHCSLSARGYSPRRPAAVDRYALARDSTALARIFTGRLGGTGRRPARTSLFGRAAHRFSARRDSAVDVLLATLPRKESSSRAPESSSPGVFASPPGPGPLARSEGKSPCRGSGIDARFPFGRPGTRARAPSRARRPRYVAALAATLRRGYTTIDRRSRGTLLHFGLRGFRLNVCYYHQDLHRRPLQPSSRPGLRRDRRARLLERACVALSLSCLVVHAFDGARARRSSAIHFQGRSIRQVSRYTFLSGCRLPWPPTCCLYRSTPFVGSDERRVGRLVSAFGSSRIASPAYQEWPTRQKKSSSAGGLFPASRRRSAVHELRNASALRAFPLLAN